MLPESISEKKVLVSCLNWGFGHVARTIPIIERLLKQNCTIFFAGSQEQISIMQSYHPSIEVIIHDDYPFQFSGKGNFGSDLLKSYFPLKKRIKREQNEVESYVKKFSIDFVITDHRYGFYSTSVPSICIVHQLNLPLKWFQYGGQLLHHQMLRKFTELWVPDKPSSRFAGKLSKNTSKFKVQYIGVLSRFALYQESSKTIENVVILSGPTIYAKQLYNSLRKLLPDDTIYIGSSALGIENNANFVAASNWKECDALILKAKKITSRSGYSTIMDLVFLKAEHCLYATPGQVEQEYLKQLHS